MDIQIKNINIEKGWCDDDLTITTKFHRYTFSATVQTIVGVSIIILTALFMAILVPLGIEPHAFVFLDTIMWAIIITVLSAISFGAYLGIQELIEAFGDGIGKEDL